MEKVKIKAYSSNHVSIILTPNGTFSIFSKLPLLQQPMALLYAVTDLRYSEIAGPRWKDVDWEAKNIQVQRRWIWNEVATPKTKASKTILSCQTSLPYVFWLAKTNHLRKGRELDFHQ